MTAFGLGVEERIELDGILDELAWKRVLKLVPRIGKATAEKVWTLIEQDRFGDVVELHDLQWCHVGHDRKDW